jgi:hypothetical protein
MTALDTKVLFLKELKKIKFDKMMPYHRGSQTVCRKGGLGVPWEKRK